MIAPFLAGRCGLKPNAGESSRVLDLRPAVGLTGARERHVMEVRRSGETVQVSTAQSAIKCGGTQQQMFRVRASVTSVWPGLDALRCRGFRSGPGQTGRGEGRSGVTPSRSRHTRPALALALPRARCCNAHRRPLDVTRFWGPSKNSL